MLTSGLRTYTYTYVHIYKNMYIEKPHMQIGLGIQVNNTVLVFNP